MRYKLLGKTGLRVSELSLGTMTFGEEWGWGASKEESKKIFDAYADAGGNFIDTANRYTEGTSEAFVGEFIAPDRDHFVVATKYSLFDKPGDVNYAGNHRKNMMRSVEASLKRLKTDYIDVLYLHAWDFHTPTEEILRGIDDLVKSGKILYAGISDTPAWIVSEANAIADLRGWTRFNALQVEYSLIERTTERDLLPMAKAGDMAVTAWAPLAGGALTGKYLKANDNDKRMEADNPRLSQRNQNIAKAVVKLANETGYSPAQIAICWTMQQNQVVIPIVGARKLKQMQDSLDAVNIELDKAQIQQLNKVSAVDHGFPHEFLKQDRIKEFVLSEKGGKIDNHRK